MGETHKGLVDKAYEVYGHTVTYWTMDLLADTTVSLVSVDAEGHCVTAVKQVVEDVESNNVSGFIIAQPERCCQPFPSATS